jgi:hypothetical protein
MSAPSFIPRRNCDSTVRQQICQVANCRLDRNAKSPVICVVDNSIRFSCRRVVGDAGSQPMGRDANGAGPERQLQAVGSLLSRLVAGRHEGGASGRGSTLFGWRPKW